MILKMFLIKYTSEYFYKYLSEKLDLSCVLNTIDCNIFSNVKYIYEI